MSDQLRKRRTVGIKTWLLDAVHEQLGEPDLSPYLERLILEDLKRSGNIVEQKAEVREQILAELGALEREYDTRRSEFKKEE